MRNVPHSLVWFVIMIYNIDRLLMVVYVGIEIVQFQAKFDLKSQNDVVTIDSGLRSSFK
jgi:hypothetical protein